MSKRIKLIGEHHPACLGRKNFIQGTWRLPWSTVFEDVWLDSLGRKNGSGTQWVSIRCADPNCQARLLVRMDVFVDAIVKEYSSPEAR